MKETKSGFRKETISHLPAFNPLEDKQTLRPPLPTELTVDPPRWEKLKEDYRLAREACIQLMPVAYVK